MQKTKTKAFANLVISVLLLAFEIWAYFQAAGFRQVKGAYVQASTFPQIMDIGMMIFTIVLLVQSLIKVFGHMKPTDPDAEAAPSMNPIKNKGVAAALFVILLCVLYTLLFDKLGYVLVSAIVSIVIMWLIGKRKPVTVILVSVLVPLVMWIVFYKLLTVNIPMGVLQPLRDLIDRI
ncbi:MAG: tripartite tricarboxylate transporter TctB family protein [Clostridia bacterium]|nr:tripartite tricarboxylate transporter TctB family protein [Clostridia bacterium]